MTSLLLILKAVQEYTVTLTEKYRDLPDYKLYEIKGIYHVSSPEYKAALAVLEEREQADNYY